MDTKTFDTSKYIAIKIDFASRMNSKVEREVRANIPFLVFGSCFRDHKIGLIRPKGLSERRPSGIISRLSIRWERE